MLGLNTLYHDAYIYNIYIISDNFWTTITKRVGICVNRKTTIGRLTGITKNKG